MDFVSALLIKALEPGLPGADGGLESRNPGLVTNAAGPRPFGTAALALSSLVKT